MVKKSMARTKKITPGQKPKQSFKNFYLTMLIFGSCITVLTLMSFMDIPKYLSYYDEEPVFVSIMMLDYLSLAIAGIGLLLLFQKRHLGLVVTFGSLAVQFILGLVMLLFVDQLVSVGFATINPTDFSSAAEQEMYVSFMRVFMYVGIPIALILTIAYAILWHFAWNQQSIADKTN